MHRVAHQFVDQQVVGGPRQLLADLLDLASQQQRLLAIEQAIDPGRVRAGLLHQHVAALQPVALAAFQRHLAQGLQFQRDAKQARPHHQGAFALHLGHWQQVVGHQAEGAARQAFAVLITAHLVDQVQGTDAQQRHQHQRGEHAAIDTQEDRVHGRCINRPGSALHHPPARLRRLRRRTDSPCCAPS